MLCVIKHWSEGEKKSAHSFDSVALLLIPGLQMEDVYGDGWRRSGYSVHKRRDFQHEPPRCRDFKDDKGKVLFTAQKPSPNSQISNKDIRIPQQWAFVLLDAHISSVSSCLLKGTFYLADWEDNFFVKIPLMPWELKSTANKNKSII